MAYFPGVGAFEQLFGSGRVEFKFKYQGVACGEGGGMLKLQFDGYIRG